eukprot:3301948-Prymnesium_polylepis.1
MRDDASAQLATSLSAKEQEFFHRLVRHRPAAAAHRAEPSSPPSRAAAAGFPSFLHVHTHTDRVRTPTRPRVHRAPPDASVRAQLSEMAGDEHHGSIEAQEAAGIGRDLSSSNRMGASEAQECLKRLEEGQWLARSDDGVYSVGIRCELQRMYTHDAPQAQAAAQVD